MNVAKFVFKFLKNKTDVVFMVTGGHAMYLNNALFHSGIRYICTHHEQTAAMAAEAYGRLTGRVGVVLVTAGPGAINALNGVVGGYMDSSPMMIISGQSPIRFVKYMQSSGIRQVGVQGINIQLVVQSVVKKFIVLEPPNIKEKLIKMHKLALSGRPGPVWIDIPLDIQNEEID